MIHTYNAMLIERWRNKRSSKYPEDQIWYKKWLMENQDICTITLKELLLDKKTLYIAKPFYQSVTEGVWSIECETGLTAKFDYLFILNMSQYLCS